jgi:hypothetical protein
VNVRFQIASLAAVSAVIACQPKAESNTENAAPPAAATPAASIEIVEPANGATVTSPVKVVLRATGVEIVAATDERPGTGHHHLFIDKDVTAAGDTMPRGVTGILHLGRGQTEFVDSTRSIKPGRHRMIAVVGDFRHAPLLPMLADTIEFTVR